MESYTPPPVDLAPIPHLSLCVNFQSFFSFWTACDTPSIGVDTTEQVARHNQRNIYICARQIDNKILRSNIFENLFCCNMPQKTAATLSLPRPRGGSTPFPHNSPSLIHTRYYSTPISSRHDKDTVAVAKTSDS